MMKKRYLLILLKILLFCSIYSCEDVIEIDVPKGDSRLILDGLTRIDLNEPFIPFRIRVRSTNNFFEALPVTSLDRFVMLVERYDEDGFIEASNVYFAEEEKGSGIYIPDPCCEVNLTPTSILDEFIIFRLFIDHNGRSYYAESKFHSTIEINSITFGNGTSSLLNSDETELIVNFSDPPDVENYYIFDFDFNRYFTTDDKFYQGNDFTFSYFYDRSFESGTELEVSILGADQELLNYMEQLIEQSESPMAPFEIPVTTVRGNVFDITGLDNIKIFDNVERPNDFALGYFALVQEFNRKVVVQ